LAILTKGTYPTRNASKVGRGKANVLEVFYF